MQERFKEKKFRQRPFLYLFSLGIEIRNKNKKYIEYDIQYTVRF